MFTLIDHHAVQTFCTTTAQYMQISANYKTISNV